MSASQAMSAHPSRTIYFAKGIAILAVVLYHLQLPGDTRHLGVLQNILGNFHVATFFLVSGFLHHRTIRFSERYHSLILRKARRLLVPYCVVSLGIIAIKLATADITTLKHPVTQDAWRHVLMGPVGGGHYPSLVPLCPLPRALRL